MTDTSQDAAVGRGLFCGSRLTREQARDEAVSTLKELSERHRRPDREGRGGGTDFALAEDSRWPRRTSRAWDFAPKRLRGRSCDDRDSSGNAVVAPPDGGLQAEDVTVIRDIIISETGMTAGQIKIVEAA